MSGFVRFAAVVIFAVFQFRSGISQEISSVKPRKPIICYYTDEDRHDHVGLSKTFQKWRKNAAGRTKTAVIDVEYVNFPANNLAKNAFQFAVEIWESHLTSQVPIKVHAEWMSLGEGVLGQAIWGRSYANFGGEQHANTFYPVALAEKIAGRQLNDPNEPDIVASFSSNTTWYFGTDGNTPSGQMDLVTIVLHEIAHGLGFTDTYDLKGTEGSVGLSSGGSSVPFIFDLFVENGSGQNLFRDFDSPSVELGDQLESANLFFNSPLSTAALGGQRPKLYAGADFDAGSSISHLDESTFNGPGDANRLMTPQIAKAESIHDPGNVLLAMLSDLGWVNTTIQHTPLKDTEVKNGQPFVVKAIIKSDNGYDANTVRLHYSTDDIDFTTVIMNPTGLPHEFQASLPGTTNDLHYFYFISVVDLANRTFTNPGKLQDAGREPQQATVFFHIGPDQGAPQIIHEPIENISQAFTNLSLQAQVNDNLGVKEVHAEYFINEGPLQTIAMAKASGTDIFTANIQLPQLQIGDKIQYRIIATDNAANENVAFVPADGFYVILVTGIKPVQTSYLNNFDSPTEDFFGNSFSIATPAGFSDGAIHSNHPYQNGDGPNEESNYIYQLQIPILIDDDNAIIRFNEIVLVEPGSEGSDFGDAEFFDYVIVEGSIDHGISWQPFADGYDSRSREIWLDRYNSSLNDDDSESTGEESLFRERVIDMTQNGNFSPGQEVLIRFRLFADALAHGWGWAIDDLAIQGPVTDAEESIDTALKIYPIPAKDFLVVEFFNSSDASIQVEVCDLQGRIVFSNAENLMRGPARKQINVQSLEEGLYIIKLGNGQKKQIRKFLKVSE